MREGDPMGVDENPGHGGSHLLYLPPDCDTDTEHEDGDRPRKITGRLKGHGRTEAIDPIRLVHALDVSQHIRQQAAFELVLEVAQDYLALDAGVRVEHDFSQDPKSSTLWRSQIRSDVLEMLLMRRQFKQWFVDGVIRSLHIQSDASPVVGQEL